MKANQTSTRAGIQDFLCPFTSMYITQGSNYGTHAGTMANDVRGSKAGAKEPYYAPCDCKLIWRDLANGQGMWQSLNKVRFANGNIAYATFVTAHDSSFDATVGQIVKQGQQLGNMGNKAGNGGVSTGVHCHIEIAQNKYTISNWQKNSHGIYCFPKEVDTDSCYFMDGTEILNGMGGNWKYLKDVPVEEPLPTLEELSQKLHIELVKKEEIINNLTAEVTELTNTIIDKNEKIKTLENRIVEVTTERDKLKAEQPTLIFTAKRSDKYIINLYKDEKLYIK